VPIPANARVSTFLPFEWLLPKVDVVVTNGGYGTVNLALQRGIPLVVAGATQDKAEVSARVAWSGAAINLQTTNPTFRSLRTAVLEVLNVPTYRTAAGRISAEFAGIDTQSLVRTLISSCAR
jgi:UDP:flavonoid glycosyltransferase YjiC (YdhE family)